MSFGCLETKKTMCDVVLKPLWYQSEPKGFLITLGTGSPNVIDCGDDANFPAVCGVFAANGW